MRGKFCLKVKAFFLLMVFCLNIIVGFACAAGLDMGFNSAHHHHHDSDMINGSDSMDSHEVEVAKQQHHHHDKELNKNNKETDDNCCNKGVAEFSQSDKILAQIVTTGIQTPVVSINYTSYQLAYLATTASNIQKIQVTRRCFPTSPGIRVSIQSFQI